MSLSGVLATAWRPLTFSSRYFITLSVQRTPLSLFAFQNSVTHSKVPHSICSNKVIGSNKQCKRTVFYLRNKKSNGLDRLKNAQGKSTSEVYSGGGRGVDHQQHQRRRMYNTTASRRRGTEHIKYRINPRISHKFNVLIRGNSDGFSQTLSQEECINDSSISVRSSSSSSASSANNPANLSNNNNNSTRRAAPSKAGLYVELGKVRLTFGTAVMAAAGYLAVGRFSPVEFSCVFLGSWILGMSGGAANQIIERDLDRQMARTRGRPLPAGHMSLTEAYVFSAGTGLLGMGLLLGGTNPLAASVGSATWVAYILYTFSKTRTTYNTHIGAVSGALPLVIGWTAAGGLLLDFQCITEFAAMWFWQFAHFNVISWQYRLDYLRAGFKMQSGVDMAKEKGRMALGGKYAFFGAVFFAATPVVSIFHGYNSPLFLASYLVTAPFVYQIYLFWKDPVNARSIKFRGRSLSPLAIGGLALVAYLFFFALSSTRWAEDGTKDFFGYSLADIIPTPFAGIFCRHCPVRCAMDNNRIAASHSSTGLDPQFHSQEEMWKVFHVVSLLCPTYWNLPKTMPQPDELIP